MKIIIEVCERIASEENGKKYHAQIKDKPGYWDCGRTPNEAIGNLMVTHPEVFNLQFVVLGKRAR